MPVLLQGPYRLLQKSQGEVHALLQQHMQVVAVTLTSDLGQGQAPGWLQGCTGLDAAEELLPVKTAIRRAAAR